MGQVKATLTEQQDFADAMLARALSALCAIERLTPQGVGQPDDVWGKVECYHEAMKIARQTLRGIREEFSNGSI